MTLQRAIGLERHSSHLSIVVLGGRLGRDARPEVAETLARAAEGPGAVQSRRAA